MSSSSSSADNIQFNFGYFDQLNEDQSVLVSPAAPAVVTTNPAPASTNNPILFGDFTAGEIQSVFRAEYVPLLHSLSPISDFDPEEVAAADHYIFAEAARLKTNPNIDFIATSILPTLPPPVVAAVTQGAADIPDTLVILPRDALNILRSVAAVKRVQLQTRLRSQPAPMPQGTTASMLTIPNDPTTLSTPTNLNPPNPAYTVLTDENGIKITVDVSDVAEFKRKDSSKTIVPRRLCSEEILEVIMTRERTIEASAVLTQLTNEIVNVTHLLNCGNLSILSPRQHLMARLLPYKDKIPVLNDQKKLAEFLGIDQWTVNSFHLGYLVVDPNQELAISINQIQLVADLILGSHASGMFDSALMVAASPDITSGYIPATYVLYCYSLALGLLHTRCRQVTNDPTDPSGQTKLDLTKGKWRPVWDEAVRMLASVTRQEYLWNHTCHHGDGFHQALTAHLAKKAPTQQTLSPSTLSRGGPTRATHVSTNFASNQQSSSSTTPRHNSTATTAGTTAAANLNTTKTRNQSSLGGSPDPSAPAKRQRTGINSNTSVETRVCFFHVAQLANLPAKDGRPIVCRRGVDCNLIHPANWSDIDKPATLAVLNSVYDRLRLAPEVKEALRTALQ